jgi:hypothetical protein
VPFYQRGTGGPLTGTIAEYNAALSDGDFATLAGSETLTNKILTAPQISQVVFPATQDASANANTLDDYEESTWTPGISFGGGTTGITYAGGGQVGFYTKIGRLVVCHFNITLTSKGTSTGSARITGLPFTSANQATLSGWGGSLRWANMTSSLVYAATSVNANDTTALVNGLTAAATSIAILQDTDFANNTAVRGTLVYFV